MTMNLIIVSVNLRSALMSWSRRRSDRWSNPWRSALAVIGPGLVVMLADTDAGSVITAAQSGAQWGYKLLLLQAVLIPILISYRS